MAVRDVAGFAVTSTMRTRPSYRNATTFDRLVDMKGRRAALSVPC